MNGNNGGANFPCVTMDDFLEELLGGDGEAVFRAVDKNGEGLGVSLYLVFGNEPGVLVSDYSYNRSFDLERFEKVLEAFSAKWENQPQPMMAS
jgi:hypothetical protein